MFRRRDNTNPIAAVIAPAERVTSVLGPGVTWKGDLLGGGGVRIEGALEGSIRLRGLLVIGESGRVTGEQIQANVVVVAGVVRGDITAEKVEIRATGRVWGNVITAAFSTEEGAFLRGQIRMEERVELTPTNDQEPSSNPEPAPSDQKAPGQSEPAGQETPSTD